MEYEFFGNMHIHKLCLTYRQNLWQCTLKNDMQFKKKKSKCAKNQSQRNFTKQKTKTKNKGRSENTLTFFFIIDTLSAFG